MTPKRARPKPGPLADTSITRLGDYFTVESDVAAGLADTVFTALA